MNKKYTVMLQCHHLWRGFHKYSCMSTHSVLQYWGVLKFHVEPIYQNYNIQINKPDGKYEVAGNYTTQLH